MLEEEISVSLVKEFSLGDCDGSSSESLVQLLSGEVVEFMIANDVNKMIATRLI